MLFFPEGPSSAPKPSQTSSSPASWSCSQKNGPRHTVPNSQTLALSQCPGQYLTFRLSYPQMRTKKTEHADLCAVSDLSEHRHRASIQPTQNNQKQGKMVGWTGTRKASEPYPSSLTFTVSPRSTHTRSGGYLLDSFPKFTLGGSLLLLA